MEFTKLHGLGNDFLILPAGESGSTQPSLSVLARRICDRHRGVGADGILYYHPTVGDHDADFSTLIFNADGSRAEMSGNGVRCLAAMLAHTGKHLSSTVRIRTVSGVKELTLVDRRGLSYRFACMMGQPVTDPARIPARIGISPGPVLNHPLEVGSEMVKVSLSSMGNPHCSTFWPDLSRVPVQRLGSALEALPCFPKGMNVEFIRVLDRQRLSVRFWERGVGCTLSSGTGSSAAAVAAILQDLVESPVTVETELGSLTVAWEPGGELFLTGPAELICSGTYPDPDTAQ